MDTAETHVVTGAFGYSGSRIAKRLLDRGIAVRALTNSPRPDEPYAVSILTNPLCFDRPEGLVHSMRGASVLYNTYWIRYNHRRFTRAQAVKNSLILFRAAREAGVQRIVHVSIANPSEDSPFEYYRGKARLERAIRESGLSYAILRPAVLFGDEDILINNIAWILRRFPLFGIFGRGDYGIRPIHVDDFAELAVRCGRESGNVVLDAVGPERFSYRQLVKEIMKIMGIQRWVVNLPPELGYWIGRAIGKAVGDVVLTRDEIQALMSGLLDSNAPSTGETLLTEWARRNADRLGRSYHSELARRPIRYGAYVGSAVRTMNAS
ncbi:MAG: NAD(P)H-binding protein [Planctomycetes bacterium]|nr:NAD(P)H-binding protein [Planctomycetota bacterium]